MAVMKLTAFNGGMKGMVAGTIFQGGVTGQVVKNSGSMNKGGLIDAIAAGSKLTKADAGRGLDAVKFTTATATKWRKLTYAQRLTWNTGASNFPFKNKFGDVYTPSGYQVFMSINLNLAFIGLDPLLNCPGPGGLVNADNFTVAYSTSAFTFSITFTAAPMDYTMLLGASKALSAGKSLKNVTFADIYTFDGSETSPFDFTGWYTNFFGSIPTGATIWFRLRTQNQLNGQYGTESYFQLTY
jgi:hypothetical protein